MPSPEQAPGIGSSSAAGEPSADLVRQELASLLSSRWFPGGSRSAQFLQFVVEEKLAGRMGAIKETSLALQLFHRKPSFDPRIDSVVRVEGHHVRRRLREYYASEGARSAVVVDLPVGSYVPVFRARQAAADSVEAGRPASRRRVAAASLAAVALAGVGWLGLHLARTGASDMSIAVLPFQSLGDPDSDALCQGLTEDVTTQLARQPQLRVAARTSASQIPASDVRQIGNRLSVRSVLEGSVRREGGRLRFTAQLIDATTGYHTWSEAFDRDAADAFAAEADVTGLIVAAVSRSLTGSEAVRAAAHVPDPEARRLFWEARYARGQGGAEGRAKAAGLLEQAVRKDSAYVDAWAALASISLLRTFNQEGPFEELALKTRSAASKAVELDSGNTDGLVALAEMEWLQDRNWNAAERRLRLALELNPSSAPARGWLATGLVSRGRFDEALKELDRAAAINPLSYLVSNDRSTALYCARRWREAVRQARRTLEVNPKFFYARVVIGACQAGNGNLGEAVREFRQASADGGREAALARLGNALARAGQRPEALAILKEYQELVSKGENVAVQLAYVRVGLGDREGALDSLETAFTRRQTDLNYMAVDAVFDPLRGNPRFEALKRNLGL
jgi:TolB-like protein/Tfp pilus assembly protein PilF